MSDKLPQTPHGFRTRGALLRAGRKVLEQKGLHKTRIADVAAEAGVAVGSFYVHFDNKEDLFRQLLIAVEDEVYGELSTVAPGTADPVQRILETNRLYLTAFKRNSRFWRVIEESVLLFPDAPSVLSERRVYYRSRTERAIRRMQQSGLVATTIEPAAAALILGAMTERLAYMWFVFDDRSDLDDLTGYLTRLWLNLLGIDDR
ncbi:TetR/AcrR family transcriptional regulator [Nocardioides marmoriginsengisoli]|nr:TetR/AcrR family transcriptional regulator [Nocardioides marmoriginsengisoli]